LTQEVYRTASIMTRPQKSKKA